MLVAFQGETGAFSEEAVEGLFPDATPVPQPSFDDVFQALQEGRVARAVIPIENSLFGSVHINYDLLQAHSVHIVGEGMLRIRHHLMAPAGARLEGLERVYSHPQALGQCRTFLRKDVPQAEATSTYDTAGAAKMVAAKGNLRLGAIASARAAATYGLTVLAASIESNPRNETRFLVLAPGRYAAVASSPVTEARAKTSLVYALRGNVPGALFKTLAVFALREIDLLKVESRPLVGHPGRYLFYLDVVGGATEEPVARALGHLHELTSSLRVLGSYPEGTRLDTPATDA
ncbi:MAG: prephenate dehydratase [Bacteroidetes bacterium]|jgi:prephenate dehydratase|nr:prephenate dehydratase [Bacteroidota bacterium]